MLPPFVMLPEPLALIFVVTPVCPTSAFKAIEPLLDVVRFIVPPIPLMLTMPLTVSPVPPLTESVVEPLPLMALTVVVPSALIVRVLDPIVIV